MEEANKKTYLYKNKVSPSPQKQRSSASHLNYNKVPYVDKKEVEYERNLAKYQKPKTREGYQNKGTKAIIEISDKGIKRS